MAKQKGPPMKGAGKISFKATPKKGKKGPPTEPAVEPRLRTKYRSEIRAALKERFGFSNDWFR